MIKVGFIHAIKNKAIHTEKLDKLVQWHKVRQGGVL